MRRGFNWTRIAQLIVVLVCALALKSYYSKASANDLRWILTPTTKFVELVSGSSFEFESNAGYISSDRSFLIASSCAGVNFLITAFLMLSMRRLWQDPTRTIAWRFIPVAAAVAYLVTLIANTVRISGALGLRSMPGEMGWLDAEQLHRFEGIFIYFGFLLLLFLISEKVSAVKPSSLIRQSFFPLVVYYATTLGMPLANGAYKQGTEFWEHSLFVVMIPLALILPIASLRYWRYRRFLRLRETAG